MEVNPYFTCDNWKKSCLEIVLSFEISETKIKFVLVHFMCIMGPFDLAGFHFSLSYRFHKY